MLEVVLELLGSEDFHAGERIFFQFMRLIKVCKVGLNRTFVGN